MPGVFPDYPAPVVRNAGAEREMIMMRWGMPPPPRAGGFPVTNNRDDGVVFRHQLRLYQKASSRAVCTEPLYRIGVEGSENVVAARTSQGGQIMSARTISQTVLCCLLMAGVLSPAHALTEQELRAKLESAGYSQIRDIKSTAEGTAVKAMKDGKEVSLVVDSSGQVKERH
jgi:hypothetical protein